jgi:hypothetical protein
MPTTAITAARMRNAAIHGFEPPATDVPKAYITNMEQRQADIIAHQGECRNTGSCLRLEPWPCNVATSVVSVTTHGIRTS